MYYSFAPYEQDFRAWWESREFPEVSPLTHDFLTHLTRPDASRHLWRHQEEALMRAVYAYELLHQQHETRHLYQRRLYAHNGSNSCDIF